jgi:hypothetical protein
VIVDATPATPAGLGHSAHPIPAPLKRPLDPHHIKSGTKKKLHIILAKKIEDSMSFSMPKRAELVFSEPCLEGVGSHAVDSIAFDISPDGNGSSQLGSLDWSHISCQLRQFVQNTLVLAVNFSHNCASALVQAEAL